jgi:hypothetical protein
VDVTAAATGGSVTKNSDGLIGSGNVMYGVVAADARIPTPDIAFKSAPPCASLRPESGRGISLDNAYSDGEFNGSTGTLRAVSAATRSFTDGTGGESDIVLHLRNVLVPQLVGHVVFARPMVRKETVMGSNR